MINWTQAQARLGVKQDGNFGPVSYAALLQDIAGRPIPAARELAAGLAANISTFQVDANADRLAGFLGETCQESAGFTGMEESGGDAYFTRNYEGRADLGNTQPGDGARFHGRGLIMLTGRANYRSYGQAIGLDLLAHPELAANPPTSVILALEYWKRNGLNALADQRDWQRLTRKINGGLNGYAQRLAYINVARGILA